MMALNEMEVGKVYPECEVATLDMVRLLIHEVDTLRMALGIPTRRTVLNKLEEETTEYD
jgi:hypothetical protein